MGQKRSAKEAPPPRAARAGARSRTGRLGGYFYPSRKDGSPDVEEGLEDPRGCAWWSDGRTRARCSCTRLVPSAGPVLVQSPRPWARWTPRLHGSLGTRCAPGELGWSWRRGLGPTQGGRICCDLVWAEPRPPPPPRTRSSPRRESLAFLRGAARSQMPGRRVPGLPPHAPCPG
jgi:hypothetical protein